uniref:Uncharacterized protein n=1 Tax=Triticum urartu TaxID=4572 RepID=A0A8R7Q9N6_TRIUA
MPSGITLYVNWSYIVILAGSHTNLQSSLHSNFSTSLLLVSVHFCWLVQNCNSYSVILGRFTVKF